MINRICILAVPIGLYLISKDYPILDETLSALFILLVTFADQGLYISYCFRGKRTFFKIVSGIILYLLINVVNYLISIACHSRNLEGFLMFADHRILIPHLVSPNFIHSMVKSVSYGLLFVTFKSYFGSSFGFKTVFYPLYYAVSLNCLNFLMNTGKKTSFGRSYSQDDFMSILIETTFGDHAAPITVLVTGILTLNVEYEALLCNIFFHNVGPILAALVFQFGQPIALTPEIVLGTRDVALIVLLFWFIFYATYIPDLNVGVSLRGNTLMTGFLTEDVIVETIKSYPKKNKVEKKLVKSKKVENKKKGKKRKRKKN